MKLLIYQIHSLTLRGAVLSYTFINSHSQVSDPGPSSFTDLDIRRKDHLFSNTELDSLGAFVILNQFSDRFESLMSRGIGFPTMWYVQPAKPQISLRIGTV